MPEVGRRLHRVALDAQPLPVVVVIRSTLEQGDNVVQLDSQDHEPGRLARHAQREEREPPSPDSLQPSPSNAGNHHTNPLN